MITGEAADGLFASAPEEAKSVSEGFFFSGVLLNGNAEPGAFPEFEIHPCP